jgi:hypothetical protein
MHSNISPDLGMVRIMVFNATFNNISVISWRSVLLVEKIAVPGENHRLDKPYHLMLYRTHLGPWYNVFNIKPVYSSNVVRLGHSCGRRRNYLFCVQFSFFSQCTFNMCTVISHGTFVANSNY